MQDAQVNPEANDAMLDMLTLMDTLQALGVDVVRANRVGAAGDDCWARRGATGRRH